MLRHMLTLSSYIAWVRSGVINPQEVIKDYQEKANKNELNSWISTTPQYVSEHMDDFLAKPLCAAPLWIKDIIMTKGYKTTCGSKMLENYIPEYSATCFLNLETAGGLMIGKHTMDEFALGGSGENCAFWPTKNPRDHSRIPWGTSSGSAASIANDECLAALGTDTWGSVRQPAAFCGIVGFKPTYGMISRYGVQAAANSLDQVGILAKTVDDAKLLFDCVRWFDPMDMNSIKAESWRQKAESLVTGKMTLKVAVFNEFFGDWIDKQIKEKTLAFIEELKRKNKSLSIDFIDFPMLDYLIAVYYIINPAEVSTNLARFDGIRYGLQSDTTLLDNLPEYYKFVRSKGLGNEAKRRSLLGAYVLSSGYQDQYYNKAIAVRDYVKKEYLKLCESYDVIVWPTSPIWPWKIGWHANDPLSDYLADIYTVPANLMGAPAMSVPMGFGEVDGNKLPLGLHIMAKPGDDYKVFQMGSIIEESNIN